MAQPPKPQESRATWIWVALIVMLSVLVIAIAFNPSGDRDGTVSDPIVMEDPGDGTGVGQSLSDSAPAPEPIAPGGEPES